ncbi:glutathione S-transferase family protein [Oceanicella actignis]|uniref:glutathione S-transferase family protein n=1 Tax=Oceanicella actignis TaxID=1189325 RepID=UPI0011E82762|nr:glutathione S-transferase family protein [Oceanicella actignis]TYO91633.1 glutathione S-transferase [Oceanicella actignis]
MSLRLFHVRHSRSFRVLWLMREMGLEGEVISLPLDREWLASEEWARINPAGKVPALIDGQTRVFESIAAMEYLCGRYGPTPLAPRPADPDYGDWLQWMHYAEAGVATHVATLAGHRAGMAQYQVSDAHAAYLEDQIARAQRALAARVASGGHILARGFSAADIAMGYTLHLMRIGRVELLPEVAAYMSRLAERPHFRAAAAEGKDARLPDRARLEG